MSRARFLTIAVITIWIAGGMQGTIATRMGGSAFTPNVILAAVCVLSTWTNRKGGLLLGFAAGVIEGALGGSRLWGFVVARMIAGVAASLAGEQVPQRGAIASAAITGIVSLLSNLLLIFLLAPQGIADRFLASIGGAITTGLIGALIGFLVDRFSGEKDRRTWGA